LMLQEALLSEAFTLGSDDVLRSDVAVAIVNQAGDTVLDLRKEWLPRTIYGDEEYTRRVVELRRRRYYGRDAQDRAGILRYTRVNNELIDLSDVPVPTNERELAWLLSFHWAVDQAYNSLPDLAGHLSEGQRPASNTLEAVRQMYQAGLEQGLQLSGESRSALGKVGITG
ncbi:MAG: hypothetical protein IIB33_06975, partial [Chloroflexi bacterium]|nr:hypothetical protein [Chloroflexota bacterium]